MTSWIQRYLPSTEFILEGEGTPIFIEPTNKVFELEAMRKDANEISSGETANKQYKVLSKGFKKSLDGGGSKKTQFEGRYKNRYYRGNAKNRNEFANMMIENIKSKNITLNIRNIKTGKIYVMKYFL